MKEPKEKTKKAIYAGSFDVLTLGHVWMIEETIRLFPSCTIAVGEKKGKKYMFSTEERRAIVEKIAVDRTMKLARESWLPQWFVNVDVVEKNRFLVDYAKEHGATHLVRGLRNAADFEDERVMRNVNSDRAPEIQTVFLMPPRELADISSSMVKSLLNIQGWQGLAEKYVPPVMMDALEEKLRSLPEE